MSIMTEPSFWVMIAFFLCLILLGKRAYFFIQNSLNVQIIKIKKSIQEARLLQKEAEILLSKRIQEEKDILKRIKDIQRQGEFDLSALSKQKKHEIDHVSKRIYNQFEKRKKLMEEQVIMSIKLKTITLLQKGSEHVLEKKKDKKLQHVFIEEGLDQLQKKSTNFYIS